MVLLIELKEYDYYNSLVENEQQVGTISTKKKKEEKFCKQ